MLRRYDLNCKKCDRKMVFGGYVENSKKKRLKPFFLCPICITEPDIRIPTDWKNLKEPPKNPNW